MPEKAPSNPPRRAAAQPAASREASRDETRDEPRGRADSERQILRGAAAAFARDGYGGTSVEAILEASGVSRRTFYRFFRSKEDVFCKLFDRSVALLLRTVQEAFGTGNTVGRVERALDGYLGVHVNAGDLARVLLLEQFRPGSVLSARREQAMTAFRELIRQQVKEVGNAEPDELVLHGVVAAINAVVVQMASEHPAGNWDVTRGKQAIRRLLSALNPKQPIA
jgi:AcrR family transcriptional regulator